MDHYASWQGLNKQLIGYLCGSLQKRIRYFLTRYHDVHNSYGRAAVLLDGKELVSFTWVENCRQEQELFSVWKAEGTWDWRSPVLRRKWDRECHLTENDFLEAASAYRTMPIREALTNDSALIRMFAIMDRRVGKRTLRAMMTGIYPQEPSWLQQFYRLRLEEDASLKGSFHWINP